MALKLQRLSDDIIEAAKASMFGILSPHKEEHAVIRIYQQIECPFTGRLFDSMDELVRETILHLIEELTAEE
ncbi:hypothetical protein [Paenibacillus polymyxa]|uniref:Uncharacterized protein n=1 Tax=Paenibacillus peoriae TaxID=59893 RepID=A0A7H0Y4B4_9BACL|nr:hypothetical protein [Paenibacillus polymyxa]KOS04100.1 hypothetical protein AM598_02865 [Paenibacillus polymyxa]QNR65922.1 hypothetical protein IAQ67_18905 [Paenibacillus peoriae]